MKTILVIGAGSRSNTYCTYFLENPSAGKVIAVAEPNKRRRNNFSERFNIPRENQYKSWEEVLSLNCKIADIALIGTLDELHYEPTIRACQLGYDIILEKPISTTIGKCVDIYKMATQHDINMMICHVMRYHPLYRKAKEIIENGVLGKITVVDWFEPINRLHYAKSFVRHPSWSRTQTSGPLTLTKACHDFDLLYWLLGCEDGEIISSLGQRTKFLPSEQPKEALNAKKCTECPINDSCTYSALENYGTYQRYRKYASNRPSATKEMAIEDLQGGPYDQCVYHSNGDVMEDYVISMKLYNPFDTILANMIISAFHDDVCWRTATFVGTEATLKLTEKDQKLILEQHTQADGSPGLVDIIDCNDIETQKIDTKMTGHSGSDYYFMDGIMNGQLLTSVYESLASHILAFDAESARIEGINWRPKKVSRIKNEINILVTTKNPEKLDAVKNIFEYRLNCLTTILGIKTDSGVPDGQPYGLEGTFQGAYQRLLTCHKYDIKEYDYIISIENGISTLNTNDSSFYLDFPIVIIEDLKNNKLITHFGGSRSIPIEHMRVMKKLGASELERGQWCQEYYAEMNYSQSRRTMIEVALLMAVDELLKE